MCDCLLRVLREAVASVPVAPRELHAAFRVPELAGAIQRADAAFAITRRVVGVSKQQETGDKARVRASVVTALLGERDRRLFARAGRGLSLRRGPLEHRAASAAVGEAAVACLLVEGAAGLGVHS